MTFFYSNYISLNNFPIFNVIFLVLLKNTRISQLTNSRMEFNRR